MAKKTERARRSSEAWPLWMEQSEEGDLVPRLIREAARDRGSEHWAGRALALDAGGPGD